MDTLVSIKSWFEKAIPEPTDANRRMQVAVHIEEFAEMVHSLRSTDAETDDILFELLEHSKRASDYLKKSSHATIYAPDPVEFLDSLCDQVVTAIGIGHMNGMDILSGLEEVSMSNDSKFVDGMPIFDAQGKIKKGPDYFKPKLGTFV
jgi:predicted HAD superfamily Cof-like phosphohydrolase